MIDYEYIPTFKNLEQDFYKVPEQQNQVVKNLFKAHIDSFDFAVGEGLERAVDDLDPLEFETEDGIRIRIEVTKALILPPKKPKSNVTLWPAECRSGRRSYCGDMTVTLQYTINNNFASESITKSMGVVPIMVKSKLCHLRNLTPEQLIKSREEPHEMGAYFIMEGHEKLMRMILVPRRNFPMTIDRSFYKNKGDNFTSKAVLIRSVKPDLSACENVLHYLANGTVMLSVQATKGTRFIPLMILYKCLNIFPSEQELLKDLKNWNTNENNREINSYYYKMLKQLREVEFNIISNQEAIDYVGEAFRDPLNMPKYSTTQQVVDRLLKNHILISHPSNLAKYNMLKYMAIKLFAFVLDKCCEEGQDSLAHQEVLTSGQLYIAILKERLSYLLKSYKTKFIVISRNKKWSATDVRNQVKNIISKGELIATGISFSIKTGSLKSFISGIPQMTGLYVTAERINYLRFLAHYRSIHRGGQFKDTKIMSIRKLMPEHWGFLCPVNTPDGSPCGLLLHMTHQCEVTFEKPSFKTVLEQIQKLPFFISAFFCSQENASISYPVQLDGLVVGFVHHKHGNSFVSHLRCCKVEGEDKIPATLEIVLVPYINGSFGQYPGIYLFTTSCRLVRPVTNLALQSKEMIGTFEQMYLKIEVDEKKFDPEFHTHFEISPLNILSVIANLIPFSDHNQSPRNLYQCQMSKQAMGVSHLNLKFRSDTKVYNITNPQSPMVRPAIYDTYDIDHHPYGTNAMVAIVSNTAYDMEDAIIINKGSVQKGLFWGYTLSVKEYALKEILGETNTRGGKEEEIKAYFERDPNKPELSLYLDSDGLPYPRRPVLLNEPLFCYKIVQTGEYKVKNYDGKETSTVVSVKLCRPDETKWLKAIIKYRTERLPEIGDKYASRHGQKGVCSKFLNPMDMPFSDSSIPDLLFNPHGFPSRMTVGLFIEGMMGKSAAASGVCHDASPFKFFHDHSDQYVQDILSKTNFSKKGTETMYSGLFGSELTTPTFFGIIYYQRLRHMVLDKFQVRATGPMNQITRQPVHGRKRGGGTKFGEMERDSLIAHGTSAILQDRLFDCSDKAYFHVCTTCGSTFTPGFSKDMIVSKKHTKFNNQKFVNPANWICCHCKKNGKIMMIACPYIFKLFMAEMSSINIKIRFKFNKEKENEIVKFFPL